MTQLSLLQAVARIKDESLIFKVTDQNGQVIAELRPIGSTFFPDDSLIFKMTKWRNRARMFFRSQFEATTERTKKWLSEIVLPSSDRILFVIFVEGVPIGHFGLCNILSSGSVELDNAIRGESGGGVNLFVAVERALIEIAFNELAANEVHAKVFSNNVLALRMHAYLGFSEFFRSPLKVVESSCMKEFVECTAEEANVKFSYVHLCINQEQYSSRSN